jgi:hypothetical protein
MERVPTDKEGRWIGAFSTYISNDKLNEALKKLQPVKCCEIRPALVSQPGQITAIYDARFLEYWKEPELAQVRLVGAHDEHDSSFEDEIKAAVPGTEARPLNKTEPDFISRIPTLIKEGWHFVVFDIEGSSAFPGLAYKSTDGSLQEQIVPKLKACGAWIQVGWQLYPYGTYIEQAQRLLELIADTIDQGVERTVGYDVRPGIKIGGLGIPSISGRKGKVTHPWSNSFYHLQGQQIAKEYAQKTDTNAAIVHVRGIILYKGSPPDLSNIAAHIRATQDSLHPCHYNDSRAIRWMRARALPDPAEYLQQHVNYLATILKMVAANRSVWRDDPNGWRHGRDLIPTQCVNQQELSLFAHLPQSLALGQYVQYARPSVPELSAGYYTEQGEGITIGVAPGKPPVVITPAQMRRHALFVGSTGSGKTYLDILLMRGLEKLDKEGKLRSVRIYLDMKGDDSEWIVQSSEAEHLIFLDPQTTGYADNPFRLPAYDHSDPQAKEIAIIKQKGIVLRMFEEALGVTVDTTPRLRRILGSNLVYLWHKKDDPTPVDLQDVVGREQEQDPGGVIWKDVEKVLPAGEFDELRRELKSVTAMPAESKDPVMGRLTDFATNLFAKQCFSPVRSTLDWQAMIQQPNTTIVIRLARLPADMAMIFQATTINSIYSALERRAETVPDEERTLVVFFVDEFQHVQKLGLLEKMHREGRTKNAVLVLSTQALVGVPRELLNVLLGSGIQGMGVPSNDDDPAMFAARWRPEGKDEIKSALMSQGALQWTFAVQGQPPVQRMLPALPPRVMDAAGFVRLEEEMKAQYGGIAAAPSIFAPVQAQKWQKYLPKWVDIPSQKEWRVLIALKEASQPLSFYKLTELLGMRRGEGYDQFYFEMRDKRLIEIEAKANSHYCSLGELGKKLVNPDLSEIAKGEDGLEMLRREIDYHQSKLRFVFPALQTLDGRLTQAPDLFVYDYATEEAFSVESESRKEVETQGQQITINFVKHVEKFAGMGLKRLEVYCHREDMEKVLGLLIEFLRDKEQFKDRIKVVAVEDLQPKTEEVAHKDATPAISATAAPSQRY